MKLLVFGATRGTGRKFIEQALERGYNVTALARNPRKLEIKSPNLQIVEGDAMNSDLLEKMVQGFDAVVSSLGAPAASKDRVRSEGTRNIIRAMEKTGVRRFISLSTVGVGDSREMLPFLYKYLLVPLFLRRAFADHEIQESYIRASKLDWTIIRPTALTNGELTRVYKHGFTISEKNLKNKISRSDVADFMLKQLTDATYIRQAPGVSY